VHHIAGVLALLVCMGTARLAAQRPQTRAGFWISGGFGYGSMDLTCSGCEVERRSGLTALIALGGTLSRQVLLGGEIEGWAKEEGGVDVTVGHVSGVVYYYPVPAAGFFLKGGAGIATLSTDAGPLGDTSDRGLGLHVGSGYDIRLGRNFSLTPAVSFFYGDFDGGASNVISIGLSATGH
jgi:hypothetical protein